jgi:hypothetical protein
MEEVTRSLTINRAVKARRSIDPRVKKETVNGRDVCERIQRTKLIYKRNRRTASIV